MRLARRIEIWFFIGALLFAYGFLITGTGVIQLFTDSGRKTALVELHPDIWWGLLLLLIGFIYTRKFWPFERNKTNH